MEDTDIYNPVYFIKDALRKEMRARSREWFSRSGAEEKTAAELERLKARLLALPELANAENIMVYLNLPREFPTIPLLRNILFPPPSEEGMEGRENGKRRRIIVPRCEGRDLRLFLLADSEDFPAMSPPGERDIGRLQTEWLDEILNERLEVGAFGILEPKPGPSEMEKFGFQPEDIDLVLVPALAFDPACRRLGKGKGYYDRFFQLVRPNVPLIGICFDWQVVPVVPTESHDRKVTCVLSPGGEHRPE